MSDRPKFDMRIVYRVAEAMAKHVCNDPRTPAEVLAHFEPAQRASVCELALAALTATFEEQIKLEIHEQGSLRSLATAYARLDEWEGDRLRFIVRHNYGEEHPASA